MKTTPVEIKRMSKAKYAFKISFGLIIMLALMLSSCEGHLAINPSTNWGKELIGVGYFGESTDSLIYLFDYYPKNNNQPGKLKELYKYSLTISGDTATFPNFLLYNFFREHEHHRKIADDSSTFLIRHAAPYYKFSKISGNDVIPNQLYFEKQPNEYPEKFNYLFVQGSGIFDSYKFEINGKDSLKVWFKGGAYNPYLYEQYMKSEVDDLYISSYLNLICNKRYDTSSIDINAIIGHSFYSETFIYNDSVFEFSTYFRRLPDAGLLISYFRSKVDAEIQSAKELDLDLKPPFEKKIFKGFPIAVENNRVNGVFN